MTRHKTTRTLRTAMLAVASACCLAAGATGLDETIDSILQGKHMTVGVAAECSTMRYCNDSTTLFPMASVFKVQVAMAALGRAKMDNADIDKPIHIAKEKLLAGTYSPLRDRHPDQDIDVSLRQLLHACIAESDNNACDLLIEFAGGIDFVDVYVRNLGISGFNISETEASMHSDVQRCWGNWSRVSSMLAVLKAVFAPENALFEPLREAMLATVTGKDKMAAGVPYDASLAHKTGSSDRVGGVKIADNDAGVVFLPGGECYLVVFIMESSETDETNAKVIADITRAVVGATGLSEM